MYAKSLLAISALALLGSTGARADEADASQFAVKFEGNRTRAEVMAEAAAVAKNRSTEPAGSRVQAPVQSSIQREALRAETVQAVRAGHIAHGEFGPQ